MLDSGGRASPYPGTTTDPTFDVVFALDTSGSMTAEELLLALSEVQGIQKASEKMSIRVIECDTEICKEYTLGPGEKPDLDIKGRGGTEFNPVFKRAKELKPDCLIYATDGYCSLPPESLRVDCPVIWVITPNGVVPGGRYWGRGKNKDLECEYGRVLRINT